MEIDTLGVIWEHLYGGGHKNITQHLDSLTTQHHGVAQGLSNIAIQQYGVWGVILLSLLPKIKSWGDQIVNYITRRKK